MKTPEIMNSRLIPEENLAEATRILDPQEDTEEYGLKKGVLVESVREHYGSEDASRYEFTLNEEGPEAAANKIENVLGDQDSVNLGDYSTTISDDSYDSQSQVAGV